MDGEYCRVIKETDEKYDIVIVDGADRVNCVKQSIGCLSENGVLILDDSSRERYQAAFNYIKDMGFRVLDFEGLKPTKFDTSRSSIIYKDDNCLYI